MVISSNPLAATVRIKTGFCCTYKVSFSHLWQCLADFFSAWKMFQMKVVEKIKTHILRSVTFFPKIVPHMSHCRKIWWSQRGHSNNTIWRRRFACWISKATDTLRIWNTSCFCMTTMVTRTPLNVTLHVHCLSCFLRLYRSFEFAGLTKVMTNQATKWYNGKALNIQITCLSFHAVNLNQKPV
jgi:hypothetical protein